MTRPVLLPQSSVMDLLRPGAMRMLVGTAVQCKLVAQWYPLPFLFGSGFPYSQPQKRVPIS